jgi:hypothetical protein
LPDEPPFKCVTGPDRGCAMKFSSGVTITVKHPRKTMSPTHGIPCRTILLHQFSMDLNILLLIILLTGCQPDSFTLIYRMSHRDKPLILSIQQ